MVNDIMRIGYTIGWTFSAWTIHNYENTTLSLFYALLITSLIFQELIRKAVEIFKA